MPSAQANKHRSSAGWLGSGAASGDLLGPREALPLAQSRISRGSPRESGHWGCPPVGISQTGVCAHVFTSEGFVTPVLRRFVHIRVVVLSFLFRFHLFRFLTLLCSWSCSCFPFLFVIAVFDSDFPHPKQADPVLGGARVASVRQRLSFRALQTLCQQLSAGARRVCRSPPPALQPRPRGLFISAFGGLCCAEVGPSVAMASPVLGTRGGAPDEHGCRCPEMGSYFPLHAGGLFSQGGPAPPPLQCRSHLVLLFLCAPAFPVTLAVGITSHPDRRLWCTMLQG